MERSEEENQQPALDHGAFMDRFILENSSPHDKLSLNGLTFAIKDIFDMEGSVTGFGNPDWRRTHAAAKLTTSIVFGYFESICISPPSSSPHHSRTSPSLSSRRRSRTSPPSSSPLPTAATPHFPLTSTVLNSPHELAATPNHQFHFLQELALIFRFLHHSMICFFISALC
ncbi:hypothetical protein Droror1_Dr00023422 [Drosera rotundifolia]